MSFTYLTAKLGSGLRDPSGAVVPTRVRLTPSAAMTNGVTTIGARDYALNADGTLDGPVAATDDAATSPTGVAYWVEVTPRSGDVQAFWASAPAASPGGVVDLQTYGAVTTPPALVSSALAVETLARVAGDAANASLIKVNPGDNTVYASPSGNDANDGLSWKTAKATIGAAITALPSGGAVEIAGSHTVSSALPQPADNTRIRGRGTNTRITYTGTGSMWTLTNAHQIHFESLRVSLSTTGTTAFYLSNSFRISWSGVLIDGGHTNLTGSTYYGQVGIQFRSNSGDNRMIDCDLNNLGEAVQTDTIMNYMLGCVVGNCYTGVHVDAGSFTGGMAIANCTFVGTAIGAAAVRAHILIDVPANQSWITNTWMEGCTTAIQAGTNSGTPGGPLGLVIANTRLAATSKCLDLQAGRQTRLEMVRFATDSGATPTELSIDATNAPDGFASGLLSSSGFDIARTVFPSNWTFLARAAADSTIAGPNLYVGNATSGGTQSYVYTGNGRVRLGYDGSRTILSDAGGSRDVALVCGSNSRQVVLDPNGVLYVGAKVQGTADAGGAVVGIRIQNAVTLPTTNPTGGGVLYVDAGALKYRGPSGAVTTVGAA